MGAALIVGNPVWAAGGDDLRARAARGDSSAQFDLAIQLLGDGKKDEARVWLEAAAQNGHPKAGAIASAVRGGDDTDDDESDLGEIEEDGRATVDRMPSVPERAPSQHPSAAPGAARQAPASARVAWTGDLDLAGQFTRNVQLIKQSGNKIKFDFRQATDSRNTREQHESMRLTLREGDKGELLLETGVGCMGRLFERADEGRGSPREARGMRAYDVDYAVTRASTRCTSGGRRKGEQSIVYLARQGDDYDVYVHKTWQAEGNTEGRGELGGRGVLRQIEVAPTPVRSPTRVAMAPNLQPTPIQPLPTSPLQGLPAVLDNALIRDSRSWLSNRYDVGSVTDTRVLAKGKDGRPSQLAGNYSYNGGMRGWIKVSLSGDTVSCVELHDFAGQCRPVGRSGSNAIAIGVMTQMMQGAVAGGSDEETMSQEAEFGHQQLRMQQLERERLHYEKGHQ